MSLVKATAFNDTSESGNAVLYGVAAAQGGMNFRNRIINGDMRIDQRNAGASVTPTDGAYTLDRFKNFGSQASKYTVQQNAGSVTPPSGFSNYLGMTVGASANVTVGASDYFILRHIVEGFNSADLAWGTASAKTVTLSFWVRSSLTGTFGGSITNSAQDRTYPFTYSIASANTWTSISITIAGDTSGTWITNNGAGLNINWGLGIGSTNSGTAGSWQAAGYWSTTGAVKWIETNGATFYITGVQLEVGTVATPFERRPYGTELALCQRYYWEMARGSTADNGTNAWMSTGYYYSTVQYNLPVMFPVRMRTSPSLSVSNSSNYFGIDRPSAANISTFTIFQPSPTGALIYQATTGGTAGYAAGAFTNNASAFCAFSAEL